MDVVVPGNTDPYLAGMPDGATASAGDTAPDESPILVEGLRLKPATKLAIRAEGVCLSVPGDLPQTLPRMAIPPSAHTTGAENGISDFAAPWNALVRLFLGPDQPDEFDAPETLDFSEDGNVLGGLNYLHWHRNCNSCSSLAMARQTKVFSKRSPCQKVPLGCIWERPMDTVGTTIRAS